MPPVLQTERIAHLSYGRMPLRCGILFQAMSLVGQTRSCGDVASNVRFARKRTWFGGLGVRAVIPLFGGSDASQLVGLLVSIESGNVRSRQWNHVDQAGNRRAGPIGRRQHAAP